MGKSQLTGPHLDAGQQLKGIDLSALPSHPPIVETATDVRDTLRLVWDSEEATAAFAQRLARCPAVRHAFIELQGDLGAGKTTLVRHLLRALGVQGRIKSPTYAVVEPHEAPGLAIWHFDFYRFNDPREWEDAGFRDVFASPGLKLAEWPEKAAGMLPVPDLVIALQTDADDRRQVSLQARTATGQALLREVSA